MDPLPVLPDGIQRIVDLLDALAAADELSGRGSQADGDHGDGRPNGEVSDGDRRPDGEASDGEASSARKPLVWLQVPNTDKYTWEGGVAIDCESRLHLCGAACCQLRFPLSEQDLLEGVVAWDPEHPYMNAHGDDGYCLHLGRDDLRCQVYDHRPLPCRAFDCRHDSRIWLDFENRIPNPVRAEVVTRANHGP